MPRAAAIARRSWRVALTSGGSDGRRRGAEQARPGADPSTTIAGRWTMPRSYTLEEAARPATGPRILLQVASSAARGRRARCLHHRCVATGMAAGGAARLEAATTELGRESATCSITSSRSASSCAISRPGWSTSRPSATASRRGCAGAWRTRSRVLAHHARGLQRRAAAVGRAAARRGPRRRACWMSPPAPQRSRCAPAATCPPTIRLEPGGQGANVAVRLARRGVAVAPGLRRRRRRRRHAPARGARTPRGSASRPCRPTRPARWSSSSTSRRRADDAQPSRPVRGRRTLPRCPTRSPGLVVSGYLLLEPGGGDLAAALGTRPRVASSSAARCPTA